MFNIVDRKSIVQDIFGDNVAPAPQAKPSGSGLIDIVNGFRWKNSGSTDEVPSLYLTEYELGWGSWAQNLARLLATGARAYSEGQFDPYAVLYYANPTGFNYNLPFLLGNGGKIRSISNQWNAYGGLTGMFPKNDNKNKVSGFGEFLGGIVGGITPGVGTEDVYRYGNTQNETITISFPLYNTVTTAEAYQNYRFVSLFSFQNVKTRTSFLTFVPPCIYTVSSYNSKGGIAWPVAIVENLTIETIGTTRALNEFGGGRILIPEAYKVNITLKQLIPTSANTLNATLGGQGVNVIGGDAEFKGAARDFLAAVENRINNPNNPQPPTTP
jgi:hypothetical protein